MQDQRAEVKMYSDYKSPYAYLAFDPGFELERKFDVRVRWRPFQLRIKGKGERSVYSEYKVRYSYLDARRWANVRPGGLILKGPLKIDAVAGLIGALGMSEADYRAYLAGEGPRAYEAAQAEAAEDHIFGVPMFIFRGEPFWGHDRIPLLERRLSEAGLTLGEARAARAEAAPHP
jgi:2-hydroxychromene-2-carboxylate isomerase